MKSVIHIFGASGSGTSTLGAALASALGYRWMDTDDYYWVPSDPMFTVRREPRERVEMIKKDIADSHGAVVSGALAGWGDELIPCFSLAVRLVTDTQVRLDRIQAREYARFGDRILEGGDMHEQHLSFMDWAASYDTADTSIRSKQEHDLWQQKLTCPLVTLDGSMPINELISIIKKSL